MHHYKKERSGIGYAARRYAMSPDRILTVAFAFVGLLGCQTTPAAQSSLELAAKDGTFESASLEGRPETIHPPFAEILAERGLSGAIAAYDTNSQELLCSSQGACDVPLGPASTYKIPHALIGLQLGELQSAEDEFKWDGEKYSVEAWNRDHTLRSAMEVSCVPCFQQLARRIGKERMTVALRELDYGNATLGGPIDFFWLEVGGLRITPRQQVEFLYRLDNGNLRFGADAMETTVDVIPQVQGQGYVLRGKTGMYGSRPPVGWYVGWLEWEEGTTYFATALHGDNEGKDLREARRAVSVEALRRFTGLEDLQ